MTAEAEALGILIDLIDDEDCRLDHHGYCQTHVWLRDGECPQARARRLLGVVAEGDTAE